VLTRRDLIDEAARAEPHGLPFDPKWTCGEDYDLLLRLSRLSPFGFVEAPATHYRIHGGQTGMNDLARVFRFHCLVQMDFVERWGSLVGFAPCVGRDAAREFLHGRAESLYWQRATETVKKLCDLTSELGLNDVRFEELRRRAARPKWLLRLKDYWERLLGSRRSAASRR
jgi:hypothetical protein